MLGHLGEDIGDADAFDIGPAGFERPAYLRRGVGLGIPGINLARAADEEEHDAVDVVIGRSRGGLQTVELWQREAKQAQRPGMEEVPPGEDIAEGSSSRGIETEHMEGLCGGKVHYYDATEAWGFLVLSGKSMDLDCQPCQRSGTVRYYGGGVPT